MWDQRFKLSDGVTEAYCLSRDQHHEYTIGAAP